MAELRPWAGAAVAVLLALSGWGCRRDAEPPTAAPPRPAATAWTWVGRAPVWAYVDLGTLRRDERFVDAWDSAGPTEGDSPLGDALRTGETLVVAWPDALFSERLNVVSGATGLEGLPSSLEAAGFAPYVAGRGQVWTRAGASWAVAVPDERTLLTGTPEAVRAAMAGPCYECDRAPAGTVVVHAEVTDEHRRVARVALRSDSAASLLDGIGTIDATLRVGLGAELSVTFTGAEGRDLDALASMLDALVPALRDALSARTDTKFVAGLLARARLDRSSDRLEIYWELGRDEVEALLAILVEPSTGPP